MKTLPYTILTAALALTPWAASAADLRVAYDVDAKTLRQVASDSPLTFELYGDPACASNRLAAHTVAVGEVDLIEKVASVRLVGNAKRPPIARLVEAVPDGGDVPAQFVLVRGEGIAPVGGECQRIVGAAVQAVAPLVPGPQGPEGPVGPQGPAGTTNVVVRKGQPRTGNGLTATVDCAPGEIATGGGGLVTSSGGLAVLEFSIPQPDTDGATPTGWKVRADNRGEIGNITLTPYVLCATP
jgi:hypothetical protein